MSHLIRCGKACTLALSWVLTYSTGLPLLGEIQAANAISNRSSKEETQYTPPDFSGEGQPTQQIAGGTSGPCGAVDQSSDALTALVPKRDNGLVTVDPYPTFWFYIPFPTSDFHSIRFVLQTEKGEELYNLAIPKSSGLPGVISVHLPKNGKALQDGQKYYWNFTLYCQDPQSSANERRSLFVENPVTKVSASSVSGLADALKLATTPKDKATVYAKYGIWFDVITILGNLHRDNPANTTFTNAWTELLKDEDVGLSNVSSKPIIK